MNFPAGKNCRRRRKTKIIPSFHRPSLCINMNTEYNLAYFRNTSLSLDLFYTPESFFTSSDPLTLLKVIWLPQHYSPFWVRNISFAQISAIRKYGKRQALRVNRVLTVTAVCVLTLTSPCTYTIPLLIGYLSPFLCYWEFISTMKTSCWTHHSFWRFMQPNRSAKSWAVLCGVVAICERKKTNKRSIPTSSLLG